MVSLKKTQPYMNKVVMEKIKSVGENVWLNVIMHYIIQLLFVIFEWSNLRFFHYFQICFMIEFFAIFTKVYDVSVWKLLTYTSEPSRNVGELYGLFLLSFITWYIHSKYLFVFCNVCKIIRNHLDGFIFIKLTPIRQFPKHHFIGLTITHI